MGAEKERLMSKPSFQHINASAGAAGSEGERSEPELPAAPADAAPPDPEWEPEDREFKQKAAALLKKLGGE